MQKSSQKQQLRLKIKKLKYKIQKQQKLQSQYRTLLNRLKRFNDESNFFNKKIIVELTIQRVLKKVSFLLEIKGLKLTDWFGAYPYDEQFQMEKLVNILQQLGVKLPRDQKGLLLNFIGDEFPQEPTLQDFKKLMDEYGIMVE